jgi:putative transposase
MTQGLVRKQDRGDFHFITFSCDQRRPYLATPDARDLVEDALERMRLRYRFALAGYVIMPEHVHLLISEPRIGALDSVLQGIKVSVSKRRPEYPFWLSRYYDFNVFTYDKRTEKLRYIHRNPVMRGLVQKPEDWLWSSFRHYAFGENRAVEIESERTAALRDRAAASPP